MSLNCVACGRPCTVDHHAEGWRDEFHAPLASRDFSMLDASAAVDPPPIHSHPARSDDERRERNRIKAREWRRLRGR